ncbi:MAG: GNAT family N-acetyltransferase [Mediterranea sp.]|jgi:diamine N-acetyltransferase|nr:GNAT family N-acetyltransferase [Mediterranea sp.]
MKHQYLNGKYISLRAMEPEDLPYIYDIENAPELWSISNFTVPYSYYTVKQFLKNTQNDLYADRQLRMVIERKADKAFLGIIDVTDFVPHHSRAEVGIVVKDEYRGEGYGTEALRLLCDYVFGFLSLQQLTAHIETDNIPSLKLFAACGFVQCGILHKWLFVEGTYKDVALMQCINTENKNKE